MLLLKFSVKAELWRGLVWSGHLGLWDCTKERDGRAEAVPAPTSGQQVRSAQAGFAEAWGPSRPQRPVAPACSRGCGEP